MRFPRVSVRPDHHAVHSLVLACTAAAQWLEMSLWSLPFDFGVCRSKVWYLRCGHQIFNINSTDPEMVVTNTKAAFS